MESVVTTTVHLDTHIDPNRENARLSTLCVTYVLAAGEYEWQTKTEDTQFKTIAKSIYCFAWTTFFFEGLRYCIADEGKVRS